MAMGAYASGILTVRYDWSPLSAMIVAAVSTGLVAFIIGAPILRVRGHYLAMITLAFSQVVIIVSTRWTEVTGGLTGIPGVPDFAIFGFSFDTKLRMYYLIWCIAIVLFLLSFRIVDSRFGRALACARRARNRRWISGRGCRSLPDPDIRPQRCLCGACREPLRALPELRQRHVF